MIVVANKRKPQGRGIYIGRPSPLGNPFEIGRDGTRAEVIQKYREWIEKAAVENPRIRRELEILTGLYREHGSLTLYCWCAPADCHGNVIRDIILARIEPS